MRHRPVAHSPCLPVCHHPSTVPTGLVVVQQTALAISRSRLEDQITMAMARLSNVRQALPPLRVWQPVSRHRSMPTAPGVLLPSRLRPRLPLPLLPFVARRWASGGSSDGPGGEDLYQKISFIDKVKLGGANQLLGRECRPRLLQGGLMATRCRLDTPNGRGARKLTTLTPLPQSLPHKGISTARSRGYP